MKLGRLIDLLKKQNQDAVLYIDGPVRLTPTTVASYRGYYDQLAIGVAMDAWPKPVRSLVTELESAVGKTFTGYKGGEFVMTRETAVWFSNYGCTSDCVPCGVRVDGDTVTLTYMEL